mgnify:CR=1 FL=1
MRKILFLGIVLAMFLYSSGTANAQSTSQTQIQALTAQLIQLQAQLTQLQKQGTTTSPSQTPTTTPPPPPPPPTPTPPPTPIPPTDHPIPGICGPAATLWPSGMTAWPKINYFGFFCRAADPRSFLDSPPKFPELYTATTWICKGANGGANANCEATVMFPPTIPAMCGTAARSYPSTATSYGNDTFCTLGKPSPQKPSFPICPTVGICTVSWSCFGLPGGMPIQCKATKEPPIAIPGICGTAATTLPYPLTNWGDLTFCSIGTPNPDNPIFPQPPSNGKGGTISSKWSCNGLDGGTSVRCAASITYPPPFAGGMGFSLYDMQNQLASIADAVTNLIKQLKPQ